MDILVKIIILLLLLLNSTGLAIVALDKYKARKRLWRIPEKTIFLAAIAGGSLGVWFGMLIFRHKTRHKKFTIGIPLIIFLQLAAAYYFLFLRP
jgi:uncharacterized membrane protein YsdA (DUF1294 family)